MMQSPATTGEQPSSAVPPTPASPWPSSTKLQRAETRRHLFLSLFSGLGHGIWEWNDCTSHPRQGNRYILGKFDAQKVLEAYLVFGGVTIIAAISSHYRLINPTPERRKISRPNSEDSQLHWRGHDQRYGGGTPQGMGGSPPPVEYGTTEVGPISLDFKALPRWVIEDREPRQTHDWRGQSGDPRRE